MSSIVKVYPWSDARGLCKILRNPSIWSASFPTLEARQMVKDAAKKASPTRNLPQVRVFKVTNDKTFGTVVVELLASPAGRKALDKVFSNRFDESRLNVTIAERLYDHHLEKHADRIPRSEEIFEKHPDNLLHFIPDKFAAWLAQRKLSPEDQRILSLYACYFALRWPEHAEEILETLVTHDEAFLSWLSDEEVASEAPPAPTPQPLTGPAKANTQVKPQDVIAPSVTPEAVPDRKHLPPRKIALPPDSAEVVHLLTSYSDWDRELSIDQLRYAVGLLTHKAERHADRLRELDELHRRARNYLKEIVQIPWMEDSISIDDYLSLPPDISAEGASEHLANVEQEATHLLQVHTQLEEIVSRLGSELSLRIPREVTNLRDIAAHLEEHVRHLTERLQQISLREQNIAEFFDRFTAADQESSHRLVENAEPSRWFEIANFIMASVPKTDAGKRYEKLVGRFDLVGLIVAHLWRLDADKAIEIAGSAVSNKQAPLTCEKQIETLAFLTFGQLQQFIDSYTATAPSVAEIIFAAAVSSGRFETFEYLEPMLHSPSINTACADFYKAVINAWRRGLFVYPAGQLNPEPPTHGTAPSENLAEKQQRCVLDLIRQTPGMTHNYHRLRIIARTRCLAPLEEVIKAGDPKTVWEKWTSSGSLDEMAEECVSASGKSKDLNPSHWSQTRRYLEIFQTGLERWCRMSQESHTNEDTEISKALASLHREARLNHNDQVDSLLTTRVSLFEAGHRSSLPPLDFGERCTTDGMIDLSILPQNLVRPTMIQSWPIATARGIVPLSFFITDQLRHALGLAPASLKDALQELLKRNEFHAAQRAADEDIELQKYVKEVVDKRKSDFLMDPNRSELLNKAQSAHVYNEDIHVCLDEIGKSLEVRLRGIS